MVHPAVPGRMPSPLSAAQLAEASPRLPVSSIPPSAPIGRCPTPRPTARGSSTSSCGRQTKFVTSSEISPAFTGVGLTVMSIQPIPGGQQEKLMATDTDAPVDLYVAA